MNLPALVAPTYLVVCATVSRHMQRLVAYPYIDEMFHVAQAAQYCRHRFAHWDPKITTPPGLYLLATVWGHVARALGVAQPCGLDLLRLLALAAAVALACVVALVPLPNYWALNVALGPLLFPYYFLFYTDAWLAVFVVASFMVVVARPTPKRAVVSAALGWLGLWFRQTNVLWLAVAAAYYITTRARDQTPAALLRQAARDAAALVPYAAAMASFAAFVLWNGGIACGDKDNHTVSTHGVQVFYCATFVSVLLVPIWASRATLAAYTRFAVTGRRGLHLAATAAAYAAIRHVITHYTIVHPFLLADNRHYTFYLYRRVLSRPWAQWAAVPVYHFALWLVPYMLCKTYRQGARPAMSPWTVTAFVGATIATLVPSPLFEPRYYIVPALLFRVFTRPETPTAKRHLYEFLWNTLVNVVLFIVFFSYEFPWATEKWPQRIIW